MTSTPYNLNKATVLSQGTLAKNGGAYHMVLQTADHIDDILALQKTIYDDLPQSAKDFIVLKDRAFFEKHFANGNAVIGIIHDGKLIAQAVILNPTAANPKTGMVDMNFDVAVDHISIIQGVLVHPDYRGNRLMTKIVDEWLDQSAKNKRMHVMAEVSIDNHFSWQVFLNEGLHIHSIGTDPADGTVVYNIHGEVGTLIEKRLCEDFNEVAKKTAVQCDQDNIAEQKNLLSKGYIGMAFDAVKQKLTFIKVGKQTAHQTGPKLP